MRRRSSLAALVAAACNQVYGLGTIVDRDAEVFDAAPSHCPPFGEVPVFDHSDLREIVPQDCFQYTRTPGPIRALAVCEGRISEGVPDEMLVPAPGLEDDTLTSPRIAEDGVHGCIRQSVPGGSVVMSIRRDTDTWTVVSMLGSYTLVSEPTSHTHPHVIVGDAQMLRELVDDGNGQWTQVQAFNFGTILHVHLSPDGLRMVSTSASTSGPVSYYDRASIDAAFVPRGPLAQTAAFQSGFLTADCGRLYFSTLNGVWFAHRAP